MSFFELYCKMIYELLNYFFKFPYFQPLMSHLIIFICLFAYLSLRVQFSPLNRTIFFLPQFFSFRVWKTFLIMFHNFHSYLRYIVSRNFKLDTSKKVERKSRLQKTCFYEHLCECKQFSRS